MTVMDWVSIGVGLWMVSIAWIANACIEAPELPWHD
jgi:hypothetical protein